MAPLIPIALQLAQVAPAVMRWLGAGEGSAQVVEQVVQVAQEVTGAATPDEAMARMAVDDAARIAFRQRIAEMANELDKAYLADVSDARRRDVELARMGRVNVRANWMVALDVVGLLACLAGLMALGYFKAQHPEALSEGVFTALLTQLTTMAGIFGLCLRDAHQFEFGSSRGSRDKDDLLAGQSRQR